MSHGLLYAICKGSCFASVILISLWFPRLFYCENDKPVDRCSYKKDFSRTREHQGGCFAPERQPLSWHSAVEFCHARGSFLAKVTSNSVDYSFMKFLGDNHEKSCFWIGASDLVTPGEWIWLDGTVLESTLPGRNGEVLEIFHPSMDKVHGCVQFCIDNVFQTIEFLKLSCDKRALLICEYELGEEASNSETTVITRSSTTQTVTVEHTSTVPVVQQRPRRTPALRPLSKVKQKIALKESHSEYQGSARLWTITVFTIPMCVRRCIDDDRCSRINFSTRSRHCAGIGQSTSLDDLRPSKEWQVWVITEV